jgi:hypothetical protein
MLTLRSRRSVLNDAPPQHPDEIAARGLLRPFDSGTMARHPDWQDPVQRRGGSGGLGKFPGAAFISTDSTAPDLAPFAFGEMVPALRVGHGGFGRDRCSWTRAYKPYLSHQTDACLKLLPMARSCANGDASRAPRRGHRYTPATFPLALTRRSGPHVAAHHAVAIGENVAPASTGRQKKDRPRGRRGEVSRIVARKVARGRPTRAA